MKSQKLYGTQGGGMVVESGNGFVFVQNPPQGFKIGDFMPPEWSVVGPFDAEGRPIRDFDFNFDEDFFALNPDLDPDLDPEYPICH